MEETWPNSESPQLLLLAVPGVSYRGDFPGSQGSPKAGCSRFYLPLPVAPWVVVGKHPVLLSLFCSVRFPRDQAHADPAHSRCSGRVSWEPVYSSLRLTLWGRRASPQGAKEETRAGQVERRAWWQNQN